MVVGDGVYIAGGVGRPTPQQTGTTLARFERFDIPTGRYERLPDLPIPLDHTGIAAHDGSIYVLGGHGLGPGGTGSTNRAFRYVIAQRTCSKGCPRWPRRAVGGRPSSTTGSTSSAAAWARTFDGSEPGIGLVEAFDTRTSRWSRVTTMPERDHLGVAALGGQIYVYAGRLPDGTTRSPRPLRPGHGHLDTPRRRPGRYERDRAAGLDGVLYTAGGEVPLRGRVLGSAWVYRVASDRWEKDDAAPGNEARLRERAQRRSALPDRRIALPRARSDTARVFTAAAAVSTGGDTGGRASTGGASWSAARWASASSWAGLRAVRGRRRVRARGGGARHLHRRRGDAAGRRPGTPRRRGLPDPRRLLPRGDDVPR